LTGDFFVKKRILSVAIAVFVFGAGHSVQAGSPTGVATEYTQLANNFQLGLQYAKQIEQYATQLLQYETQLKNLILAESPGITEVMSIVSGVGQVMSAGKSIGATMAQIDRNFAKTFKNATAASLAENFTRWNNTSLDTLEGALKASGKIRDQYPSDAAMLQALYEKSQSTKGARDSIQMVAAINSEQINQLHKLSNLIATQNIATSTYMANMTDQSMEQIAHDKKSKESFLRSKPATIPDLDTSTRTYEPVRIYKPK
jgi:P-type conjugative transfer protein TrbJ